MPDKDMIIIPPNAPLAPAARIINEGGVVAFPTETFYGLAVDPFNTEALDALYELKGREDSSPISVVIGEIAMLNSLTGEVNELARDLINRFWPGPLTLLFSASANLPSRLTAGTGKIGVRVPALARARELSIEAGGAITATSANPSGQKSPVEAGEVTAYFDSKIDALIEGGTLKGGEPSTLVDVTGVEIKIIREGAIAVSDL